MTDHLTEVHPFDDGLIARCPEHGAIGRSQPNSRRGINAICTEARAHDHLAHGVRRSVVQWFAAVNRGPRQTS